MPGGDSTSDGVVIKEDAGRGLDTSAPGGDAASEGVVIEADISALGDDAVSKGVVEAHKSVQVWMLTCRVMMLQMMLLTPLCLKRS